MTDRVNSSKELDQYLQAALAELRELSDMISAGKVSEEDAAYIRALQELVLEQVSGNTDENSDSPTR